MTEPVDVDSLPQTQRLILEVLAARYRTGERCWSFSTRDRKAIEALVQLGLVDSMSSPAPKTIRARLTDAGRSAVVIGTYEPPDVKRLRAALRVIAQYADDCAASDVIERRDGFTAVADMARRAAAHDDPHAEQVAAILAGAGQRRNPNPKPDDPDRLRALAARPVPGSV